MRSIRLRCLAAIWVLTLLAGHSRAAGEVDESDTSSAAELFREGDRHVASGAYRDALEAWKRAYLKQLPDYRSIDFKAPVTAQFMEREALKSFLFGELAKEYPDEKILADQVLHPEKYRGPGRDDPVIVEFAEPSPFSAEDWELVKENTLGEFQIEVLLRPNAGLRESRDAAAGWDGDTYRLYRAKNESARTVIVWTSVWDSNAEAEEFARAFAKFSAARDDLESSSLEVSDGDAEFIWSHDAGRCGIWLRDDRVIAADNAEGAQLDSIRDWAAKATQAPKRIEIRRFEPMPDK